MTKKTYSPGPNCPITVHAIGDNAPSDDYVEPIVRSMLEMGDGNHDGYRIDRDASALGTVWTLDYSGVPLAALLEHSGEYHIELCRVPQEMGLWMADFYAMACMHFNAR